MNKQHPHLRGVICHDDGMVEVTHLKPYRGQLSTLTAGHIVKGYRKICHRQESGSAQKLHSVHRLIAETFIPNPDNLPEVNHINEDKLDNRVDNLEWCTRQYNTAYSKAKNYIVETPAGDHITVTNLKQYCEQHSLDNSNLTRTLRSGRQHKGYKIIKRL